MAWGWGLKQYTEAHGPPDPVLDDPTAFRVFVLMDDGIFVEPELGTRPWSCAATFERGLAQLLGPKALNFELRRR